MTKSEPLLPALPEDDFPPLGGVVAQKSVEKNPEDQKQPEDEENPENEEKLEDEDFPPQIINIGEPIEESVHHRPVADDNTWHIQQFPNGQS